MYLLNDNGQIDYTLHSGGGPLEIQYLNMLNPHSRYWTLQDFVRFLVVEIGRKGGWEETKSREGQDEDMTLALYGYSIGWGLFVTVAL